MKKKFKINQLKKNKYYSNESYCFHVFFSALLSLLSTEWYVLSLPISRTWKNGLQILFLFSRAPDHAWNYAENFMNGLRNRDIRRQSTNERKQRALTHRPVDMAGPTDQQCRHINILQRGADKYIFTKNS